MPAPKVVVVPLGTGGTAAGLALAFAIAGRDIKVIGARVVPRIVGRAPRVRALANRTSRLIENLAGTRSTHFVERVDGRSRFVWRRVRSRDRRRATRRGATAYRLVDRPRWDLQREGVRLRARRRGPRRDLVLVNIRLQNSQSAMTKLPEVTFHIYPTDCDMLGHLNHATMLNFLERARGHCSNHRSTFAIGRVQPVFR
jgi:hypothetical protein